MWQQLDLEMFPSLRILKEEKTPRSLALVSIRSEPPVSSTQSHPRHSCFVFTPRDPLLVIIVVSPHEGVKPLPNNIESLEPLNVPSI